MTVYYLFMSKKKRKTISKKLKAVDFFCGAGGMTKGFTEAGINVLAGIDIDSECQKTYTSNNSGVKFIHADIKKLTFKSLKDQAKIKRNDKELIFIGCSPCQYWSKIKTDKTKSEESKNLLKDFQRFVHHFKPGYIVIENVPGILHRFEESPLKTFLNFLNDEGYSYKHKTINACHFGVPQTRRRFVLIASRVKRDISFPKPDTKDKHPTVRQFIGSPKIFKRIKAGHKDETGFMHSTANLSENNLKRLKMTPANGGTRIAWKDSELQIPAYIGKDDSFQDIYGRMYWDKPAPTITTKFHSITNGRFAHPTQHRGISLREGARLQTFALSYKFYATSLASIARLIGNAVPPELSKRIAQSLI